MGMSGYVPGTNFGNWFDNIDVTHGGNAPPSPWEQAAWARGPAPAQKTGTTVTTDAGNLKDRLNYALGSAGLVGGQSGPSPEISVGPVWNDQQVQQRVNASRAGNDAATAGRTRAMQQSLAGRGYGGNSPLAQALGAQYQGQNLAANTAAENDTRWTAAQGNAQHVYQTQMGRSDQFGQRMQEDIERRKTSAQYQGALLQMLGNLS